MSSSQHCAAVLALTCFCGMLRDVISSSVLVVVPSPIHSHQVVFRPFTQELVRRGHQVVVLTTDPAYPPGQSPQNLTEIDLHDLSYKLWQEGFQKAITGKQSDFKTQVETAYNVMLDVFPKQMQSEAVKGMLADESQRFDLVVVEAWVYQALALAHVYQAPAILMSTAGIEDETYEDAGAHTHPILFPDSCRTRRYNVSGWELAKHLYIRTKMHHIQNELIVKQDQKVKELFGAGLPSLQDMRKNVDSYFLSWHSVWEPSRPLPPSIVHVGGLHCVPPKELPEDLKTLMDSSQRGVIYMSFGSSADPSLLPPEQLDVFARVFETLPYDVIWKWKDALRGFSSNVHTFAWLPQPDLLRHENLLLFITQGGLQSTEEALRAGVPLLGIPLVMDQWLNVENYERLGVGIGLDLHALSETRLRHAIKTLIDDKSYRETSLRIGREIQDRRQTALQRAVWYAERAIRLRGRRFPTAPPSLTWDDIIQALLIAILVVPLTLMLSAVFLYRILCGLKRKIVVTCYRCLSRDRGFSYTRQSAV